MCNGKLGSYLDNDRTMNMGQGSQIQNCTKIWYFMVLNYVLQFTLVTVIL